MSVLVQDRGFVADDWPHGFTDDPAAIMTGDTPLGLDLAPDCDVADLPDAVFRAALIKVTFDSFADGRVFGIARQLRLRGFQGRVRLAGPVLADQYAMARRVGFDEVEISNDHAARQPEASWLFRADWTAHDYQARLRG